jgi:cysteinyl-tRNA synthetase
MEKQNYQTKKLIASCLIDVVDVKITQTFKKGISMKIYNTLSGKKEEFIPINEGEVKMYVCGPTVYDFIHIGNARPYTVFDTIRKYLEYKGYQVTYVQNFTDVDDKIINRANTEQVSCSTISEKFIQEAINDAKGLGVKEATYHPKATCEIDEMIRMVETLVEKGYAYEVNGTVFFSTKKFKDYGKLSKKNIEDLEAGARIAINDEKRDPMDFVLWKKKKEGEPSWTSPWGDGRPGWHIECSAMAKKYLGETIDIHAGGVDLIFPHHENEIAQSEAANGKPFAKYWIHNGFINIDNKKMSKSKGNFFTVRDIVKQFPYEVVRFFILSAHYRSPINFSQELLEASAKGLERIQTGVSNLEYLLTVTKVTELTDDEKILLSQLKDYQEKFEKAMDDDFNSADGISVIFELIKFANQNTSDTSSILWLNELKTLLLKLCDILGVVAAKEVELLDEEIEGLIEQRQQARKNKDFALSDQIRDELKAKGIILEDTREGVKYKRV